MSKTWKRVLSVLLTALLVAAFAAPAAAAGRTGEHGFFWQKVSNGSNVQSNRNRNANNLDVLSEQYKPNDTVRVSILLDAQSTLDKFGYKNAKTVARDPVAINYRNQLKAKQNLIAERISTVALDGEKLDVVWNLTLAANVISANVKYGKIADIEKVIGVKAVALESSHVPEKTLTPEKPAMTNASIMTNTQLVWESGYTGAGSIVAVIDSGLDTEHELFDGAAFDYAIAEDIENGFNVQVLDEATIDGLLSQLHVSERMQDVSAADLYLSSKVPFAFNYADDNLIVNHLYDMQTEHGTHVAGIAAGNRYIPDGNGGFVPSAEKVYTLGQAPDAQLLVMKYFGSTRGYDGDYFAAIEDAILLGADSVNLSLGTGGVAGFAYNRIYRDILQKLQGSDLTMVTSAGNAYSWSETARYPGYLYTEDVNFNTVGSPGSYSETLSVASVENDGVTGNYMEYEDEKFFFSETPGYGNEPIQTIAGTHEFIYVDSFGTNEEFAAVADVLAGKIAICNRGTTSFFEKANAAVANGAIATIIVNNQPGVIKMNLTGYNYNAPAVSILQSEGAYIKETAEAVKDGDTVLYYTGEITVSDGIGCFYYGNNYFVMSDFSSWGVNGNLTLKPEITAPGGNIYSAFGYNLTDSGYKGGHDQYESMSGTSMAAPQISGIIATFAQYVSENGLVEKTGLSERQLITSLLMSTANPLIEEESGSYYSVLKQGAGLVDLLAAVSAKSYILMDEASTPSAADGKVKAELGQNKDGVFDIKFTINNFSDEDVNYMLDSQFFTQDIFLYYLFNEKENAVGYATYLDTLTALIESDVDWYVNGEKYDYEAALEYDFNDDGLVSHSDIETILEYVIGSIDEFNKMENADLDEDGDIDSYDALLALDAIDDVSVTVHAGESAEITLSVELLDIADFDDKGAYIEGYVFAAEQDTYDGAIGVVHSIPVLGYYGDWSEPSMYDHGSAVEYYSYADTLTPYMASVLGADSYIVKTFLYSNAGSSNSYMMIGNPYVADYNENGDYAYYPERNALNSGAKLDAVRYTQIRNAVGGYVAIVDDQDDVLFSKILGSQYAAHYDYDRAEWQRPYTTTKIGYTPGDNVEEGTVLTAIIALAPEYYQNEDGSIRWDEVGDGAYYSISYKIDNTAPVIDNVDLHYDTKKGGFDRLNIVATDNQYISAVYISTESGESYAEYGSATSAVPEGETREFELDFTELIDEGTIETLADIDPHILVTVYDYAGNLSTYKINLNPSELNSDIAVDLSNTQLRLYKGNTAKLFANVTPWGIDDAVVWTSSDDTVATVDENGIVTAVAEGIATISATSVSDENAFAECEVEVFIINNTIHGALQDEVGTPLVFEWDLNNKTWEAVSEIDPSVSAGVYDMLYGVYYIQDESGFMHALDGTTFEELAVSEASTAFGAPVEDFDMAYVNNMYNDQNKAYAVAETYLLYSDDIMDNTFDYGYNFADFLNQYSGGTQFISIAWIDYDDTYDYFFALDDMGFIWEFDVPFDPEESLGISLYNSDFRFEPYSGYDTAYNSMVMGDDGELYLAHFTGTTSEIYQITFDVANDCFTSVMLGDIGEDVWPAVLFGAAENPADAGDGGAGQGSFIGHESMLGGIKIAADVRPERIVKEDTSKTVSAKRSLPVVEAASKVSVRGNETIQSINTDMLLLDITLDEDTTNSFIELAYDPEVVSIIPISGSVDYSAQSFDPEAGLYKLAFVAPEGLEAGTPYVVAMVTIDQLDVYTELVLTVHQINSEDVETVEIYPIGNPPVHEHVFGEPEWTWAGDYSMASVTVVCDECEEEIVIPARVSKQLTEATYEEAGKITYTATARFGDTEFTDTVEVVLDKLEYTYGEPVFVWSEDGTVKVTVIRLEDEEEIELEAGVDSKTTDATHTDDGSVVYTATVEFNGAEYTDEYTVVIPATGHEYGEPIWAWSDDYTLAVATFVCETDESELVFVAEINNGSDGDGNYVYTASVVLGDDTYTDVITVPMNNECTVVINTVNGYNEDEVSIIVGTEEKNTPYDITAVTGAPDYILGDVDGKGSIDTVDYAMAKRAFLGSYVLSDEQFKRADINGNGKLDVADYAQIKRHVLGSFTIKQPEEIVISEGQEYTDFVFITVDAEGCVISVDDDLTAAKGDTAVPDGGYIIAIHSGAADEEVISLITEGTEIGLGGVELAECAGAEPNTVLEDATFSFVPAEA